jgi:hypothetical protein
MCIEPLNSTPQMCIKPLTLVNILLGVQNHQGRAACDTGVGAQQRRAGAGGERHIQPVRQGRALPRGGQGITLCLCYNNLFKPPYVIIIYLTLSLV